MADYSRSSRLRRTAQELWTKAEPAQVQRPLRSMGSVLSVRMSRDTLQSLTQAARRQGKGPATFARELIEQGLALESNEFSGVFARVLERLLELRRRDLYASGELSDRWLMDWRSNCTATGKLLSESFGGPEFPAQRTISWWGRAQSSRRTTEETTVFRFTLSSPPVTDPEALHWWRRTTASSSTRPTGERPIQVTIQ